MATYVCRDVMLDIRATFQGPVPKQPFPYKQTKTEHKLARGNMHTGKCGLYIQEHIILVGKHDGTGFTRG